MADCAWSLARLRYQPSEAWEEEAAAQVGCAWTCTHREELYIQKSCGLLCPVWFAWTCAHRRAVHTEELYTQKSHGLLCPVTAGSGSEQVDPEGMLPLVVTAGHGISAQRLQLGPHKKSKQPGLIAAVFFISTYFCIPLHPFKPPCRPHQHALVPPSHQLQVSQTLGAYSALQLGIILWAWKSVQLNPAPESWVSALTSRARAEGLEEERIQVRGLVISIFLLQVDLGCDVEF